MIEVRGIARVVRPVLSYHIASDEGEQGGTTHGRELIEEGFALLVTMSYAGYRFIDSIAGQSEQSCSFASARRPDQREERTNSRR